MRLQRLLCAVVVVSFIGSAGVASAQTYSADARKVAMGGVSDNANIASSMVDSAEPYTVILIPFGLIQVIKNHDQFDPTNDKFDPVSAIEGGASPLHYQTGRGTSDVEHPEQRFVTDLVNG